MIVQDFLRKARQKCTSEEEVVCYPSLVGKLRAVLTIIECYLVIYPEAIKQMKTLLKESVE